MSDQALALVAALIATAAWIRFAEHPTARNLRVAIVDTFEL